MKIKPCFLAIVTAIFFVMNAYGQSAEIAAITETSQIAVEVPGNGFTNDAKDMPDDTFYTAGLFVMTLFMMIALCILTAVGIALTTLILGLVMAFAFAGIVSTSLLVGLYKKSFEKGFRVLVVLGFGFCGLITGGILFTFINRFMHWTIFGFALSAGLILGLIAGLTTGYIGFGILKAFTKGLAKKTQEKE